MAEGGVGEDVGGPMAAQRGCDLGLKLVELWNDVIGKVLSSRTWR
jgi:hypothetical protein